MEREVDSHKGPIIMILDVAFAVQSEQAIGQIVEVAVIWDFDYVHMTSLSCKSSR